LTRFCLLNPFGSRDPKSFGIDLVLKWLALALPKEDADVLITISKSPDQIAELQPLLVRALLTALRKRIQDLLDRIPKEFSVVLQDRSGLLVNWKNYTKTQDPERYIALIRAFSGLLTLSHEGTDAYRVEQGRTKYFDYLKGRAEMFTKAQSMKHSVMGAYYLLVCVSETNLRIRKQALQLLTRVNDALQHLDSDLAIDAQPSLVKAVGESYLTPFQNAIALWIESSNLPDPVIPNLAEPINSWLGNVSSEQLSARDPLSLTTQGLAPRIEDLEENLRAPLGVLRLVLTETLGIPVPDLPYLSYRRPGGWTRALNHWLMNEWRKRSTLSSANLFATATGGHGGIGLTSVGYTDGGAISLEAFKIERRLHWDRFRSSFSRKR
jgi:hypothetical protein